MGDVPNITNSEVLASEFTNYWQAAVYFPQSTDRSSNSIMEMCVPANHFGDGSRWQLTRRLVGFRIDDGYTDELGLTYA